MRKMADICCIHELAGCNCRSDDGRLLCQGCKDFQKWSTSTPGFLSAVDMILRAGGEVHMNAKDGLVEVVFRNFHGAAACVRTEDIASVDFRSLMVRLLLAEDIRIFDRRTEEYGTVCITPPHDEGTVVVIYDGALSCMIRDDKYAKEFFDYV